MKPTEQERLVEQYLGGSMSPDEEQEFFIKVAVDSNLRQTLKAYRVVESALRKHRDAVAVQHVAARGNLMAALQKASQSVPAATSHSGNAGRMFGAGRGMVRFLAAAVTVASVTVAGWMGVSWWSASESDTDTPRGMSPARAPMIIPAPGESTGQAAPAVSSESSPRIDNAPAASAPISATADDAGNDRPSTTRSATPRISRDNASSRSREIASPQDVKSDDASTRATADRADDLEPPAEVETPRVQKSPSDTVNIQLKIGLPKR